MSKSLLFNELIQLINIKIEHFIGNTLDIILLQLKLNPKKRYLILTQLQQLLQLILNIRRMKLIRDENLVVKGIHDILLEVLF
jgi:hypothetical protein